MQKEQRTVPEAEEIWEEEEPEFMPHGNLGREDSLVKVSEFHRQKKWWRAIFLSEGGLRFPCGAMGPNLECGSVLGSGPD